MKGRLREGDELMRAVVADATRRVGISATSRVLIALSGGPDSCALLLLFCAAANQGLLPRPVGVAHFHHGLRGTDADAEAAFAAALALRHNLPCVIELGKVIKGERAPYDAARRERYAFLQTAAYDLGADTLATAHTADDQAETVLGRVLRGTGLDGLTGIPPARTLAPGLRVVRPLLGVRRAEVEAYCAAQGITPCQDPSNQDDRRPRARLRKRLPELAEAFNPRLTESLCRLAETAAWDAELLSEMADALYHQALREAGNNTIRLDREILRSAPTALRRRVWKTALWQLVGSDPIVAEVATTVWIVELDDLLMTSQPAPPKNLPGGVRVRLLPGEILLLRLLPR